MTGITWSLSSPPIPLVKRKKRKQKKNNNPSRAGVWEGVVMAMEGWRGRCSGDGLGSDSGLELKSFYGKSRFWHYAQGFRAMCIYTYPAPQTEVLPDTGTHEWRAWERHSDQELVPKEGSICFIHSIYVHGWKQEAVAIFRPAQACKQHWIGKYILSLMSSLALAGGGISLNCFFSPELFEGGK